MDSAAVSYELGGVAKVGGSVHTKKQVHTGTARDVTVKHVVVHGGVPQQLRASTLRELRALRELYTLTIYVGTADWSFAVRLVRVLAYQELELLEVPGGASLERVARALRARPVQPRRVRVEVDERDEACVSMRHLVFVVRGELSLSVRTLPAAFWPLLRSEAWAPQVLHVCKLDAPDVAELLRELPRAGHALKRVIVNARSLTAELLSGALALPHRAQLEVHDARRPANPWYAVPVARLNLRRLV